MRQTGSPVVRSGYWCECAVRAPMTDAELKGVASIDAYTPEQAVRWVRVALRTLVSALSPDESQAAHAWLDTGREKAIRALRSGRLFELAVTHGATRVLWTIRPVGFLRLAHREQGALPSCVDWFPGMRMPGRKYGVMVPMRRDDST